MLDIRTFVHTNDIETVGLDVLTPVLMKSYNFWNITPCSPLKVKLPASYRFLAWLILQPWRGRQHVPPKHRLTFNRLHGIITPMTELSTLHYITELLFWIYFCLFICLWMCNTFFNIHL
jgi:hypothetical protein